MDDLKQIVAANIVRLRTSHKLTQLELGEKLNYSDKTISKWERGESLPDAYVLKQLSELFLVSVDYLLNDHSAEKKLPLGLELHNRLTISSIVVASVWTLGLLIFVILLLCGYTHWQVFAYTLPVSLITMLVFNSVWGRRKSKKLVNFFIVSALIWSILAVIYLIFLRYNWWSIFLLGIPAQIIALLGFRLRRTPKIM